MVRSIQVATPTVGKPPDKDTSEVYCRDISLRSIEAPSAGVNLSYRLPASLPLIRAMVVLPHVVVSVIRAKLLPIVRLETISCRA